MSLKKTDMVKNLAKKLDGKRKAAGVPQRFAQGSAEAGAKNAKAAKAAEQAEAAEKASAKLVPLACRLPAALAGQLRDQAVAHEGGVNAIVAEAVEQWLQQRKPVEAVKPVKPVKAAKAAEA